MFSIKGWLTVLTESEAAVINEKMRALGAQRSAIRELFEYGLGRKAEIGEDKVFDFSLGNPSVPAPKEVNAALRQILDELPAVTLHGYTPAPGDIDVRRAVAEHIKSCHGFPVSADYVYMTVGAAAALTATLGGLICPGDEVILLCPYFPEYRVFVESAGGKAVEVMTSADSFLPDPNAIREAITDRTAAIIINSPNNPTGTVYPAKSIKDVAEVLNEASTRLARAIYLIADEPYRELTYGAEVPYIPNFYDHTVVCYSYSKSLSIPGERIGYAMVSPRAEAAAEVYQALAGAARAQGYVCAPALLQRAIPRCLGLVSDLSVYDENRRLLLSELSSYGFTAVKPEGAFYLFMKAPTESASEFCEAAKRHELLLVPSDSFGCNGYVRISYCVPTEQIKRALPAFRALAREYNLISKDN